VPWLPGCDPAVRVPVDTRQAPQLGFDERQERFEGTVIAVAPRAHDLRLDVPLPVCRCSADGRNASDPRTGNNDWF